MEHVFKIIHFLKNVSDIYRQIAGKKPFEMRIRGQIQFFGVEEFPTPPNGYPMFCPYRQVRFVTIQLREQVFVVHTVKRKTFHTDDEG